MAVVFIKIAAGIAAFLLGIEIGRRIERRRSELEKRDLRQFRTSYDKH